jgi:8-oxo-dGTP diphosphatase
MILATLCYVKRDGQTLMLHRNKKPNDIHEGKWNGLGGKFEAGESPEMCIRREVQEEAGLFIHNPRLHGLLIFVNFKGNDWYVFVFSATGFDGELIDSSEGKLEWIDDDKLLDLPLWPSDAVFLPWLKKDEFFSARFLYDGDSMLEYEVTFH